MDAQITKLHTYIYIYYIMLTSLLNSFPLSDCNSFGTPKYAKTNLSMHPIVSVAHFRFWAQMIENLLKWSI